MFEIASKTAIYIISRGVPFIDELMDGMDRHDMGR